MKRKDTGALYTPTGNDDAIDAMDAIDAIKRARVVENVRLMAGAGTSELTFEHNGSP